MLTSLKINPINQELAERVQAHIDYKTKPPGSLGLIEKLALQMALIQGTEKPASGPAELLLFAADHGLVQEGVSAWPSEVTTQMVANFLAGGAAANVFARSNGVNMTIVDGGIIGDLPDSENLRRANIRKGTRNAMHEDAMTEAEVEAALEFGAGLAIEKASGGAKVITLGEMGIGNTSSATLLAHAIHGLDIETMTGPGAGLDAAGVSRKVQILEEVARRRPAPLEPMAALAAYGGLEIAMMAGAMIGAASKQATVLVDGFIASSAAMVALAARPEVRPYLVFAHKSEEPGHQLMLETIKAEPLLDLGMRLGEGTGGLLAYPLLVNACAMLNEMATFDSAGVSDKV